MPGRAALLSGALFGAAAVALGAFGKHGLRDVVDAEALGWWQTAVQYQMWHALALLTVAAIPLRAGSAIAALFIAGTLAFSGSLYIMVLTGWTWLGTVTPLGGVMLTAGWLMLVVEAVRRPTG